MPQTFRRYIVFFRMESEEAPAHEDRLNEILNRHVDKKKSITDAYTEIFELGMEAAEQKMRESGESVNMLAADIQMEIRKIKERQALDRDMNIIYEDRGEEGFEEWCEEHKYIKEGETFLERRHTLLSGRGTPSWSDKAKDWLSNLLADGTAIPTAFIRSKAVEDGLIGEGDGDREWGRLRTLAHREGYTSGNKGTWQRNSE